MLSELFLGKPPFTYPADFVDILRLIRSENVGPRTFLALIKFFGNPRKALENIEEFSTRGGKSKPIKIFSQSEIEKELELLTKNGAKLISYQCPHYSKLLLQIPDLPPILSYKGDIELLNYPQSIAIVGARNASINGCTFATKIAKELIELGYITVSGLARGIDTAVHQAATDKTIAVLAGGIDYIYPPENTKLYQQIADNGLIIAELPIGSKPLGQHFPQRNRLISALALGTIVVEASLKSGSLITAKCALEQNREVFAVPGFPLDPRSQGANKLIKDGAYLVESVQDITLNLPDYAIFKKSLEDSAITGNNFKLLENKETNKVTSNMRLQVTELLSPTPVDIDCLAKESGIPLPVIYAVILELELAGSVIRHPGNKISLVYK